MNFLGIPASEVSSFTVSGRSARTMDVSISPPWKSQIFPGVTVSFTAWFPKNAPQLMINTAIPSSLLTSLLKTWMIGEFPPWQFKIAIFLNP